MNITIESNDYDIFNQLVNEISIMIPIYPYAKPIIYNIDWHNLKMELFSDINYYHIFISMLKKYIISKKIKISMNLPFFPMIIYDDSLIPNEDYIITMEM